MSTFRPSNPPIVHVPATPTTGQIIKESIVSGVGSGIGFSAGTRIMNSIFGPTIPYHQPPPPPPPQNTPTAELSKAMEKCLEHSASMREEIPLCLNLFKTEQKYREFQQCMQTSDNNVQLCRDFLPSQ
jgi:hypothetical protein